MWQQEKGVPDLGMQRVEAMLGQQCLDSGDVAALGKHAPGGVDQVACFLHAAFRRSEGMIFECVIRTQALGAAADTKDIPDLLQICKLTSENCALNCVNHCGIAH